MGCSTARQKVLNRSEILFKANVNLKDSKSLINSSDIFHVKNSFLVSRRMTEMILGPKYRSLVGFTNAHTARLKLTTVLIAE